MTSIIATKMSQCVVKSKSLIRLSTLGLAACLLIIGCSETAETTTAPEKTEAVPELLDVDDSAKEADTSNEEVEQGSSGKPVSYEVDKWDVTNVEAFGVADLDKMKQIFGTVVTTDENSLDYASNTATKYRFMKGEEPYLDIIDSETYLEFGWYFANPNDTNSEKENSVKHAKKVYTVAQGLMGENGTKLVESMLGNQITKNKSIGDLQVELAKCEFYSCMLIIKKAG